MRELYKPTKNLCRHELGHAIGYFYAGVKRIEIAHDPDNYNGLLTIPLCEISDHKVHSLGLIGGMFQTTEISNDTDKADYKLWGLKPLSELKVKFSDLYQTVKNMDELLVDAVKDRLENSKSIILENCHETYTIKIEPSAVA